MSKLEILAPAGGIESVYPAVRMGADAVYIGAWKLGARAHAHNFDPRQLRQAVEYCHARGVKVYLTCNTLMHDYELTEAMEIIKYASSLPVDALIMQDIGLISLVRQAAPDMRLHASTQMSVHTLGGVKLLEDMGFSRVVLSRELSRDEIAEIASGCKAELEVFVHGALCMSVSGQCYFSAMLGSRSGNRGACAQPCRLPFAAKGGTGHDLSLKDVSLIEHLRELESIGVTSAKIEGRMKRPEYVAAAVAACRQSLDRGIVEDRLKNQLQAVFSRSGFTDGYFTGKTGRDMFGVRLKENVTAASEKILSELRTTYKDEKPLIPVSFQLDIHKDKPVALSVSDGSDVVKVNGSVPEQAINAAVTSDRCKASLSKTGGTPFYLNDFRADIEDGLAVPASVLNALRREALGSLLEKRSERKTAVFSDIILNKTGTRQHNRPKSVRARVTDPDVPDSLLDCELIYVPMTFSNNKLEELMDRGFALAVEIPRGMFGIEQKLFNRLREIRSLGIYEVLAGNLGAIQLAKSLDMDIHGGFGLNITNTESVIWAEKQGLMDAEVSIELKLSEIAALGGHIPLGIVSCGRLPLILTRNCPIKNDGDLCKHCHNDAFITDRRSMVFPVQCSGACSEVLNSVPVMLADRRSEIIGVDFEVMRFSVENPVEIDETIQIFNRKKSQKDGYTRGLYYRGVE